MKQEELEQKIFRKFVRHYPAKLKISSMRSTNPPKPDIEIDCQNGKTIAFEISEIVDQGMSRRLQSRLNIANLCRKYYKDLPSSEKRDFTSKYGNSLIYIVFQNNTLTSKRQKSIPYVFNYLLSLCSIEKENVPKEQNLKKIVRKIRISNGDFIGPCFDTDSVGFLACPLLNRIQDKFDKAYKTQYPCELLLYYDLQPEIVSKFKLDDTCEYAQKNIHKSVFKRLWIYSLHNDKILARIKRY